VLHLFAGQSSAGPPVACPSPPTCRPDLTANGGVGRRAAALGCTAGRNAEGSRDRRFHPIPRMTHVLQATRLSHNMAVCGHGLEGWRAGRRKGWGPTECGGNGRVACHRCSSPNPGSRYPARFCASHGSHQNRIITVLWSCGPVQSAGPSTGQLRSHLVDLLTVHAAAVQFLMRLPDAAKCMKSKYA